MKCWVLTLLLVLLTFAIYYFIEASLTDYIFLSIYWGSVLVLVAWAIFDSGYFILNEKKIKELRQRRGKRK